MTPGADQKHVSASIFGLNQLEAGAIYTQVLLCFQHLCPNAVALTEQVDLARWGSPFDSVQMADKSEVIFYVDSSSHIQQTEVLRKCQAHLTFLVPAIHLTLSAFSPWPYPLVGCHCTKDSRMNNRNTIQTLQKGEPKLHALSVLWAEPRLGSPTVP